ncbi:winged helix-turn-helix domain-containing protein [Roseateles sp.]|uniref:winged helix-turn-helix domain-containing protein n=1 Tax=Roseateles sp. TaxID=1971397 RepID=UPI003D103267
MLNPERERFSLGDWIVDAPGNRLLRGEESRPLRHKAMALLVLLARHAGETVSRDEIIDSIWDGNRFVAPKAINTAIWAIRQALGDDPDAPRYLETVAKKGYRLIAPVAALPAPARDEATAQPPPAEAPARRDSPAAARPARKRQLAMLLLITGLGMAVAWLLLQRAEPGSRPLPSPASTGPGTAALARPTPLTQTPGQEYLGQLSPDGQQLAFAWWQGQGVGQLYLRPAADLNATPQLISAEGEEVNGLAWSPDGQALAYVATREGGQCKLWLYHLKAGRHQELAPCLPMFTPTIDWSPDGKWIAFSATADGVAGLFLIAPDGSGLRRLSASPPAAMADHQPAWSPDSQALAFARQDPADGSRDVYEITLDGRLERLSQLKLYSLHGLTYAATGRDLIFSSTRQDTRVLLRWDRASASAQPLGLDGSAPKRNADGSLVYALLRNHVSIASLAWGQQAQPERRISSVANDRAPDIRGTRIAFVSNRSGQPELWLADGQTSAARRLTQLDSQVATPAWSADGERLAFLGSCGPGKRFGLCVLKPADASLQVLAADAANYGRPSWRADSQEVWVSSDRGGAWQLWRFAADGSQAPVAVPTHMPPGRAVQWTADGQSLVYQPRHGSTLRLRSSDGQERELAPLLPGESLVDWRLGPQGLVVLSRGSRERFRVIELRSGRQQSLSVHALGTFPELASFTLAADGTALVEVSNTAVADLMQLR